MFSTVEVDSDVMRSAKDKIYRPKSTPLVAVGISNGSKISLANLIYVDRWKFSSVFIYPINNKLSSESIYSLDSVFSKVEEPFIETKEFKDLIVEKLNENFLKIVGNEVPMTSYNYRENTNIFHHGFTRNLEGFLLSMILSLKNDSLSH